jgi:hypothetical protein
MMTAMLTVRNILADNRAYDIWQVNEDAEYHEAGDEGAQARIGTPPSEDQQAALDSVRPVPRPLKAA